jgi:hypothetical protein
MKICKYCKQNVDGDGYIGIDKKIYCDEVCAMMNGANITCPSCGEKIDSEVGYYCGSCGARVCSPMCLSYEGECYECIKIANYEDCVRCGKKVAIGYDEGVEIDGKVYCSEECALECNECGKRVDSPDKLKMYEFSEWENGYKKYFQRYICDDCYNEINPDINPDEIARELTDDPQEQEEITELIQNNIDTNGKLWKLLVKAENEQEKWDIIRIMGIARDRHELTDYDELLQSGMSKESARELKS